MTKDEVIIVKNIPKDIYSVIAYQAMNYALISIAFTYNRMEKSDLSTRIGNITKGKIAEGLFNYFCIEKGINLDFKSCATPFWMADMRDFLWLGGEWDIKNNFLYCSDRDFTKFDFTLLPALIPNKNDNDQWSKRNETYHLQSKFTAYVFTFMRLKPDDKHFFSLHISDAQYEFITSIASKYKNLAISEMPFAEQWFFDQFLSFGSTDLLTLRYYPELIITSCANARYWSLFKDTSIQDHHYQDHISGQKWYQKTDKIIKFLNGALVTKIRNKTCPVGLLPSFQHIIREVKV